MSDQTYGICYPGHDSSCQECKSKDKRIAELESLADLAWGVIANVSEGDWRKQQHEWETAATRWRDNFLKSVHPPLKGGESNENERPDR